MSPEQSVANHHAGRWWDDTVAVQRFVGDLIADELKRLRPGTPRPQPSAVAPGSRIDQDMGADSLELLSLATALAETIHLHESGIEDYLLVRRSIGEWAGIAAQGLDFFSDKLTFRTSGSSGLPKSCTHTLAGLFEEIEQLVKLFDGRRRILTAVPCHHIYGFLFTILLPHALGIPPDDVIDVRGSLPSALARRAQAGDLIVGHPEFWGGVARSAPAIDRDVVGVTSSGPCPDETSEGVIDAGLAALYQVYGASETGGIGWRNSTKAPYTLFPYWSKDAGRPECLVRTCSEKHYEAMPVPDVLEWLGSSTFKMMARRDDAVQVGGTNVFPAQVRDVLLRHPDVRDASVRLMRPDEGIRLKAFIVPRPGSYDAQALHLTLTTWVDLHLPAAARPKAFTFGKQAPRTATGKLSDWSLKSDFA